MDHTYAKKTNIDIENNEPDFVSGESEVEEMMGEDGEDPGREAQEGSTEEAVNVSLAPTRGSVRSEEVWKLSWGDKALVENSLQTLPKAYYTTEPQV